jgi:hypothetical protein
MLTSEHYPVIDGVIIPLKLGNNFIASDLEKALEYYPKFVKSSKSKLGISEYISALLDEISKEQPNGYTGEIAFDSFLCYIGLKKFCEYLGAPKEINKNVILK